MLIKDFPIPVKDFVKLLKNTLPEPLKKIFVFKFKQKIKSLEEKNLPEIFLCYN